MTATIPPDSTPLAATSKPIPQAKGWPVLGNALAFRRDSVGFLEQSWRQLGDLYGVNVGGRRFMILSDPELTRQILIEGKHIFKRSNRFDGGTRLTLALGHSLLTTDGEPWLIRRRMMQPIFHRQRLQAMGAMMVAAGVQMLERWQEAGADTIYLDQEMKLVTLDIINRTMFSTDFVAASEYVAPAVEEGVRYVLKYFDNPFALPRHWPTPANRRFARNFATLDAYLYGIIRQRRAALEGQTGADAQPADLLDMLIAARDEETGEGMTDAQVRNEVATVFAAGHDTTASGLTWAWYALSQHPAVLHKLQAEVDRVLGGRTPTIADLPNLPYTQQVFEETLRLFPPIPYTVRLAYEATTLGGYAFAKDAAVLLAIYNMHRHPDYWERPEEFWPERFAAGAQPKKQNPAYLPFLSGQHQCVGYHFALMEGTLLLAMMAQHYALTLAPGQQIVRDRSLALWPRGGMKMQLSKRPSHNGSAVSRS